MSAQSPIRKAVIPAAGLGTRSLPASKVVPKELFPIGDRPVLQLNVEEAVAAGIEEVILVVSPRKRELIRFFERDAELEKFLEDKGEADILKRVREIQSAVKVTTVVQEEPRGLGDAILMAREAVGSEPFAVILPDDLVRASTPCLAQLISQWRARQMACVAVREVPHKQLSRYGVPALSESEGRLHRVSSVVEKPHPDEAPSQLAIVGRYVLPADIFDILARLTPGALGEIQLTDALQKLADGPGLMVYEFEGEYYDTGNRLGFVAANVAYSLNEGDEIRNLLREMVT